MRVKVVVPKSNRKGIRIPIPPKPIAHVPKKGRGSYARKEKHVNLFQVI